MQTERSGFDGVVIACHLALRLVVLGLLMHFQERAGREGTRAALAAMFAGWYQLIQFYTVGGPINCYKLSIPVSDVPIAMSQMGKTSVQLPWYNSMYNRFRWQYSY